MGLLKIQTPMRNMTSVKNGIKLHVANMGHRSTEQNSYKRYDDMAIAALEWKNEAWSNNLEREKKTLF